MNVSFPKVKAREDEIHLYLIGDVHSGTVYHATNEFAKAIKAIKDDPLARFIDMGDKAEFISPSDPRWDVGAVCPWVHEDNIALDQADYYCDMIAPIADKCDGTLEGNHEEAIRKHSHINIQDYICRKLNIRNLAFTSWLHYSMYTTSTRRYGLDVVVTHGSGSATTRGARLNKLEKFMGEFGGQLFGFGHMHDVIIHPGKPMLNLKSTKLKQECKIAAMTGCFFRTYTQDQPPSYGEKQNYPATVIGYPMFVIKPSTGGIEVRAKRG